MDYKTLMYLLGYPVLLMYHDHIMNALYGQKPYWWGRRRELMEELNIRDRIHDKLGVKWGSLAKTIIQNSENLPADVIHKVAKEMREKLLKEIEEKERMGRRDVEFSILIHELERVTKRLAELQ